MRSKPGASLLVFTYSIELLNVARETIVAAHPVNVDDRYQETVADPASLGPAATGAGDSACQDIGNQAQRKSFVSTEWQEGSRAAAHRTGLHRGWGGLPNR